MIAFHATNERMKLKRNPASLACLLLAVTVGCGGSVAAYDRPDFSIEIFSRDGLSLEEEQHITLLEALAAIASNFPGNPRVDDDLREKALAIALRIEPLHYHSRIADRELSKGLLPGSTAYFESITLVSETLWRVAERLSTPPLQPDGVRLAPYLMELSLITHPDPPLERLVTYASATEGKSPQWERFTTLQADVNRSTSKTLTIRQEAAALLKAGKTPDSNTPPIAMTGNPEPPGPNSQPSPQPVPSGPISTSLAIVRSVASSGGAVVPGRVSLMVRAPQSTEERALLSPTDDSDSRPALPLFSSKREIPVTGFAISKELATARGWQWPQGVVGEVGFSPVDNSLARSGANPARVFLASAVLVESYLRKKPLNEDFIVCGEGEFPSSDLLLTAGPLDVARAAAEMERQYLLLPASSMDKLVTSLQTTEELEPLFKTELIACDTIAEALDRALSPTEPALLEASTAFAEIEAVSSRMTLPDLARNAKVQERLVAILEKYPDHLSAKAMLEFGRRPISNEAKVAQFSHQIDTLVAPFLDLDRASDLTESRRKLAEAKGQLSVIRNAIPVEARDLFKPAGEIINAAGLYLDLSNRTTSIAYQRIREID